MVIGDKLLKFFYPFQMLRNLISKSLIGKQLTQCSPIRCLSSAPNNMVNVDVNDKTGIASKCSTSALSGNYHFIIFIQAVTLNRPPVNSLNLELLQDISSTLDDLESNKSRGMILTSVRNCT